MRIGEIIKQIISSVSLEMSSWHAVDPWSWKEEDSEVVYNTRGPWQISPVMMNHKDTCKCWGAAIKIQAVFRGMLVRNPTGIPTKEFSESIR